MTPSIRAGRGAGKSISRAVPPRNNKQRARRWVQGKVGYIQQKVGSASADVGGGRESRC